MRSCTPFVGGAERSDGCARTPLTNSLALLCALLCSGGTVLRLANRHRAPQTIGPLTTVGQVLDMVEAEFPGVSKHDFGIKIYAHANDEIGTYVCATHDVLWKVAVCTSSAGELGGSDRGGINGGKPPQQSKDRRVSCFSAK